MKKILILHRSDLFNLTSDLSIEELQAEHFKIQIKDFNSAEFIAFEENGMLKILKNLHGPCVTMPWVSFLMVLDRVNKIAEFEKTAPRDMQEEVYFKPDNTVPLPPDYIDMSKAKIGFIPLDEKVWRILNRIPNDHLINVLEDEDDEINSSVATAIEQRELFWENRNVFPQTLWQAILFFIIYFNDVPALVFQHTEIHFTSTLKIGYPEIYAKIKKECGFWCQDTELYKNLSTIYKCDHEECLINVILKGIYRFKNAFRDRSMDFKDVLDSYNPNKKENG